MTSGDVLAVMDALSAAGCRAWLDGGWAVDAIIGEETRKHDDLDLVGELGAVEAVRQALASPGYRLETDERPVRVVFVGASDRSVDLHTVVFDQGGGGVPAAAGWRDLPLSSRRLRRDGENYWPGAAVPERGGTAVVPRRVRAGREGPA